MIGALDWLMSARSFDALRFHGLFGEKVEVDLFGSMLARQQNFTDDTVTPPVTVQNNGSYLAAANAIYKHSAKLRMEGYAVFIPNRGARNLGQDIATHWAYAMITLQTP